MHLLIVSPRFPPTNAVDSQRMRMLLPHLASQGCKAEILAVDPSCCANGLDPWQAKTLPPEVPIHHVRGISQRWARLPGLGSIDARCRISLARAGSHLLRQRGFDAVYFSTTAFGCFRLGPLWKRRHGVPFLLDYQDPWVNDHYRIHPEISPPGGRLKYAVVDSLHRFQEPRVLRHAAGYTAVSAAYPAQLQARYPFAAAIPSLVLPFPGSQGDFDHLEAIPANQLPFDSRDGLIHWVCIGRADASLFQLSLSGLFEAIARHAPAELRQRLRLHFLGTSYAPAGRGIPSIAPLAARYGLGAIVEERTDRLPLSITLATLKAADALLVLGSNDPGYTASKLVPYLLARRPLLAVMHEQSLVCELLQRCGGGQLVSFAIDTKTDFLASRIAGAWLASDLHAQLLPLDRQALRPHTAAGQAEQLVAFLRQCR
jgi:hypothetical protein